MAMSPSDFMMEYRSMTVPLIDGTAIYNVDVHEYRNAKDYYQGTDDISSDHDVADGMGAFKKLKNAIIRGSKKLGSLKYRCTLDIGVNGQPAKRTHTEDVDLREFELCFAGKGSPQQLQQVLRLAQAYGFIRPEEASMKRYVTKYLGIDCSGFVSNYLRVVGGLDIHPAKVNSIAYRSLGKQVKSLAEVQGRDVVAWAGTNHVAIIDSAAFHYNRDAKQALQSFYCLVVESTGADATQGDVHSDGLMCTYYMIMPADQHSIFTIARSLGWEQAGGAWKESQDRQKKTFKAHIRRLL
jgi:hypothetical protein